MGLPITPNPMNPMFSAKIPPLLPSAVFRCRYNPSVRIPMKHVIAAAALVGLVVAPLSAGGRGTVSGSYVEARTAEVVTGGFLIENGDPNPGRAGLAPAGRGSRP